MSGASGRQPFGGRFPRAVLAMGLWAARCLEATCATIMIRAFGVGMQRRYPFRDIVYSCCPLVLERMDSDGLQRGC